ncbi:MAG: extracellular solute-binding protein [Acetatifactor sp.]|nr:extracellular solute-binding protein [Acetatifactor sp.]
MKRNKHNHLGYFVCSLMLCISLFLTACSKDSTSDNDAAISGESTASHITQEREWVYVPEVITVEDELADYERMQPVGDTFLYVSLGEDTENSARSICRYSLTDRALKSVPVNRPEEWNSWDLGTRFFTQDQELYITANVYPADYSSMKRFLCKFDTGGNCLFSKDITEQAGRDVSLDRLTVDGQGRLYIFTKNGEILLYTGDGDYHGSVSYSSPEDPAPVRIKGACDGADGKYYVCISQGSVNIAGGNTEGTDDEGARCALMEIDFENARMFEVAENLPDINGLCAGEQYDLLLYDDRAVYGYNFAEQKSDSGSVGEELFVWMDSDINGYYVTNLYLLEDGRLCATVEDWINEDRAIVALERTKAEQAPRREELVIVTVNGGSELAAMAVKFNRGNSRYHLTVKSYESLTDLYNAILTKEPIDLIDLSGINVQKLASRGFFEDLTPYVDQSEMLDRSDFVDGILDVYTFDNTLVGIPSAFLLRTVVGNGAQMKNKTGLTLEELFLAADRYPGAKAFDGITKEEMMQYLMMFNEDTFIDWDTGTCYFDSETFKAVLKYVSQFPDTVESGKEEESLPTKIQNGEVLFAIAEMNTYDIFQEYVGMFGEDAACVGFPTAGGRGGHLLLTGDAYAIATVSEHKEAAWNFIEEFLAQEKSELYYATHYTEFSTLKRTLNEKAEDYMGGDRFPMRIYEDGWTFQYHALTWDELNVILELIPDATPFFSVKDDEIIKIINEEAPAYYSGQKGIDDVVGVIQNRVQLYVNENR